MKANFFLDMLLDKGLLDQLDTKKTFNAPKRTLKPNKKPVFPTWKRSMVVNDGKLGNNWEQQRTAE